MHANNGFQFGLILGRFNRLINTSKIKSVKLLMTTLTRTFFMIMTKCFLLVLSWRENCPTITRDFALHSGLLNSRAWLQILRIILKFLAIKEAVSVFEYSGSRYYDHHKFGFITREFSKKSILYVCIVSKQQSLGIELSRSTEHSFSSL